MNNQLTELGHVKKEKWIYRKIIKVGNNLYSSYAVAPILSILEKIALGYSYFPCGPLNWFHFQPHEGKGPGWLLSSTVVSKSDPDTLYGQMADVLLPLVKGKALLNTPYIASSLIGGYNHSRILISMKSGKNILVEGSMAGFLERILYDHSVAFTYLDTDMEPKFQAKSYNAVHKTKTEIWEEHGPHYKDLIAGARTIGGISQTGFFYNPLYTAALQYVAYLGQAQARRLEKHWFYWNQRTAAGNAFRVFGNIPILKETAATAIKETPVGVFTPNIFADSKGGVYYTFHSDYLKEAANYIKKGFNSDLFSVSTPLDKLTVAHWEGQSGALMHSFHASQGITGDGTLSKSSYLKAKASSVQKAIQDKPVNSVFLSFKEVKKIAVPDSSLHDAFFPPPSKTEPSVALKKLIESIGGPDLHGKPLESLSINDIKSMGFEPINELCSKINISTPELMEAIGKAGFKILPIEEVVYKHKATPVEDFSNAPQKIKALALATSGKTMCSLGHFLPTIYWWKKAPETLFESHDLDKELAKIMKSIKSPEFIWAYAKYVAHSKNKKFFIRPCPHTPNHGQKVAGFESKLVVGEPAAKKHIGQVMEAIKPGDGLMVMPLVEAHASGVFSLEAFAIGPDNDGVTAGRGMTFVFPASAEDYRLEFKQLCKLGGEDPNITEMEFVYGKSFAADNTANPSEQLFLTQLRRSTKPVVPGKPAPSADAAQGFIPDGKLEVHRIIQVNDLEDLPLVDAASVDGTLIVEPKGSVLGHASATSRARGLAYACGANAAAFKVGDKLTSGDGWVYPGTGDPVIYEPGMYKKEFFEGLEHGRQSYMPDALASGIFFHEYTSTPLSGDPKDVARAAGYFVASIIGAAITAGLGESRHARYKQPGGKALHLYSGAVFKWLSTEATNIPSNRSTVYSYMKEALLTWEQTKTTLHMLHAIFARGVWQSGYGGIKWSDGMFLAYRTVQAILDEDLDKIIFWTNKLENVAHNGGWMFNKFSPKAILDFSTSGQIELGLMRTIIQSLSRMYTKSKRVRSIPDFQSDHDPRTMNPRDMGGKGFPELLLDIEKQPDSCYDPKGHYNPWFKPIHIALYGNDIIEDEDDEEDEENEDYPEADIDSPFPDIPPKYSQEFTAPGHGLHLQ